ncbi:MAG TPA: Uma2 family endonuclease [Blastocatellia bacterium]|nr:Uma2 family endonuclease [Blastocatellia bacterium]
MSTTSTAWLEIIERLPADSVLTLRNISWKEYEELLEEIGESAGLRISYGDGILRIMTLSTEHETYVRFLEGLMTLIRVRLSLTIRSVGSATMKKPKKKGLEPDASFYVQTAHAVGHKLHIDFSSDPPPDIAVEIDVHHDSRDRLPIYAALGMPELWRFDGKELIIYHLADNRYIPRESSIALPFLSGAIITGFLSRIPEEGESEILVAFDEWLQSLQR